MLKILFSEKVKNDLKNISDFISLDSPIHSILTITSIIKTIKILADFPFVGKIVDDDIRELVESKYKYKVVYQTNEKYITILSIYKYQNNWK